MLVVYQIRGPRDGISLNFPGIDGGFGFSIARLAAVEEVATGRHSGRAGLLNGLNDGPT